MARRKTNKPVYIHGKPPIVAPAQVWRIISRYVGQNPLSYTRLARVCRGAHSIFTSNYLWRQLVVYSQGSTPADSYHRYLTDVSRLNENQLAFLRQLWTLLGDERLWRGSFKSSDLNVVINSELVQSSLILSLPYSVFMGLFSTHMLRSQRPAQDLRDLPAWTDRDFALKAFGLCGSLLSYAPQYSNDFEAVSAAVHSPVIPQMWLVGADLRANKNIVKPIVAARDCFQLADPSLWDDEEVVTAAVGHSWRAYLVTSPRLRNDYDISLLAMHQSGRALENASDQLRNNREIVGAAVSNFGLALEYASPKLRGDRATVTLAVTNNGMALEFAAKQLHDARDVVLAAVQADGHALRFTSTRLRGNRTIVLAAVKQRGSAFQFATKKLQRDEQLVEEAIALNSRALEFASPTIQARLRKRRAREEGDDDDMDQSPPSRRGRRRRRS